MSVTRAQTFLSPTGAPEAEGWDTAAGCHPLDDKRHGVFGRSRREECHLIDDKWLGAIGDGGRGECHLLDDKRRGAFLRKASPGCHLIDDNRFDGKDGGAGGWRAATLLL